MLLFVKFSTYKNRYKLALGKKCLYALILKYLSNNSCFSPFSISFIFFSAVNSQ